MVHTIALNPLSFTGVDTGSGFGEMSNTGDFVSFGLQLMRSFQQDPPIGPTQGKSPVSPLKEETRDYMDALREALLKKGKPLNKVTVNNEDLSLLKAFLCQCGYSIEDIQRLLKVLEQENPGKEINLLQLHSKLREMKPRHAEKKSIILDPSSSPSLESALKAFNLDQQATDRILAASREETGGIDIKKLLVHLKKQFNTKTEGSLVSMDQKIGQNVSGIFQKIGPPLPEKGATGNLSLKDFISCLEEMTGEKGKTRPLPPHVEKTVERLAERLSLAEEREERMGSMKTFSKLSSGLPSFDEKVPDGEGRSADKKDFLRAKGGHMGPGPADHGKVPGETKPGQSQGELPSPGKSTSISQDVLRPTEPSLGTTKKNDLSGREPGQRIEGRGPDTRSPSEGGLGVANLARDPSSSGFLDTLRSMDRSSSQFRVLLPTYVIDQVGKQISQSVLNGEKILRIQLRPPDLGLLKVDMDMKDNVLKLGMLAENSSVKEVLISSVHELREALVEQGIRVERIDVQVNSSFQDSLAGGREGFQEGSKNVHAHGEEHHGGQGEGNDSLPDQRSGSGDPHRVDLVA